MDRSFLAGIIITEFCLRFVICLGKLILLKGSVYIFLSVLDLYAQEKDFWLGMKNRSLQVRFLKSILPAFNR